MNLRLFSIQQALRVYKLIGQQVFDKPLLARKAFETLATYLPQYDKRCGYIAFTIGEMEAEWIKPNGADADKVLLFCHGGGYATGSLNTHRALATQLAVHANIKTVAIEYSLAPEAKFPKQIHQFAQAYQYLLEKGYKAENIACAGESAGAGLITGGLLYLKDQGVEMPNCALLLSPWLDLTISMKSHFSNEDKDPMIPTKGLSVWSENYAPGNKSHPYVSPIFGDLKGLCPMYIQVGDSEVLMDDSVHFAALAKKAGVEIKLEVWRDMFHAWQGFWMILPEGKAANIKLSKYLKEKMKIAETYKAKLIK
jgi:monoterpene epsilon-lactone hydrolase